ncbi:DUF6056 family protein [Streptomyces sp. NPDC015350]|uniref:DUF6056 family protein n=1 Tax=Streptomyces sp. NPDC015350 TaxID=3364955 RepID=UPI0036F78E18
MSTDTGVGPYEEKETGGGGAGDRPRPARRRAVPWAAVLALFPFALLGAAFRFGRLVRPGADDWCFLPVVRDEGALGMLAKFYLHDNGRVANALLVVGYGAFGVPGHQWFAPVSGTVVLGVLWALTAAALGRAGLTAPRGAVPLVAATATAVFLLATPDTYKTFYWPANSVSHTLAPVLACAAVIPLLRARTRRGHVLASATALVAGVFIGTLSEETTAVACVVLGTVLLTGLRTPPGPDRTRVRSWCAVALAGLATGTAVLYLSPGARARRARFGADTGSMLDPEALGAALRAFGEILGTVLTTWPYLGAVAAGVLLGLSARGGDRPVDGPVGLSPRRRLLRPVLAGLLAFLVSGYLCVVVTRPVFGADVVTASRVWGDFLLLYVLLLTGIGVLLGRAVVPQARRTVPRTVAAAVAAAVCVLACAGLAGPLLRLGTEMSVRARDWDHQDRWLRDRAARGARVLPYAPVPVGGMLEPFGGHGRRVWPAPCVARYYHLDEVTYSPRLPRGGPGATGTGPARPA